MKTLTQRQRQVLDFVGKYIGQHCYPPTMREIGEHFGFMWPAARGHLSALERKGFIRINQLKARGIEVAGLRQGNALELPVAGRIRAGRPLLASEEAGERIVVDRTLFKDSNAFALRVTGDSMIDAGILDGDYVVVRPQSTIKNGEVGVVLIGDEATVKRVYRDRDKGLIILKPENKSLEPVSYRPDEVSIIGKVIGVIRKL